MLLGICLIISFVGCSDDDPIEINVEQNPAPKQLDMERVAAEINHFCGDCHATPPPSAIPKNGWFAEIQLMFEMYEESGRNDLQVPQKGEVVEYYRTLAPDKIELPPTLPRVSNDTLKFTQVKEVIWEGENSIPASPPAIANLTWYDASQTDLLEQSVLLGCEMQAGHVFEVKFDGQKISYGRRAAVANPSHSTLADLDQDGTADYLIADLGSFLPEDHNKGKVVWLRPADDHTFSVDVLLDNLGRVTDIQTGDFNEDGQVDLIVAEFGWRTTGNVWLLTQTEFDDANGVPSFTKQRIDDRHGVIHVPTVDINRDGHLDFVSVISQEHEAVELFVNRGDGTFRRQNVFAASSPAWGSTGIDLTDLDNDGDTDILYTNGDIFDTFYIVPYHSAHWIENQGDGQWEPKVLGNLPGIHRAVAGDMDLDGDQDVICCSLISDRLESISSDSFDSIIWLEQTEPGTFVPHSLEKGNCNHPTIVVADFDQDGDLDIATAQFEDAPSQPRQDISIWWNNLIIPE